MSNKEAAEAVVSGYRLPSPQDCPPEIYNIMTSCWRELPEERLSFKQIFPVIDQLVKERIVSQPPIRKSYTTVNPTVITVTERNRSAYGQIDQH